MESESLEVGMDLKATSTLLIVDDEENILRSLNRLFRPQGYRVITAGSGAEGLEILEKTEVDLVISDMRMPEMPGDQFLEQVAERWPQVMRILLTGYSDVESTISAINKGGIYKYISKPWEENDIKISVRRALEQKALEAVVHRQNLELKALNNSLEARVQERTEELKQIVMMLELAHDSLKQAYEDTITTFSNLIEAREGDVAGHARRVAELARNMAVQMGLNEVDAQDIYFAGLLHDVGKIGLPDRLLNTPFDRLSDADRDEMIKHCALGEMMLMPLEILRTPAKIIHAHHERYDGSGYPDGIKGDAIPLSARILAIADDYDALQSGMMTSNKMSAEQAEGFIVERCGKHYTPQVVDALTACLRSEADKRDVPMKLIRAADLKPGMVVAKDLVSNSGVVLLARGNSLDQPLIDMIKRIVSLTGKNSGLYIVTPT